MRGTGYGVDIVDQFRQSVLGRTGLTVGRLGVADSYGAPATAFEEAFERGCNYFYWGSGRKRANMRQAVRNLVQQGQRDNLVVALHSYARLGILTAPLMARTLKSMRLEYADVLMLGWHNRPPSTMLMDRALALKEKGLFRFIGMSGHNRGLFPRMALKHFFDVFHIRYNAAHRGAEQEAFPSLLGEDRPGIVTYTATRWGQLLNPKKMEPGTVPATAAECYRFVLSNPMVDVCLCGPADIGQMREALSALDRGPLSTAETERMRAIGDYVHGHAKGFF